MKTLRSLSFVASLSVVAVIATGPLWWATTRVSAQENTTAPAASETEKKKDADQAEPAPSATPPEDEEDKKPAPAPAVNEPPLRSLGDDNADATDKVQEKARELAEKTGDEEERAKKPHKKPHASAAIEVDDESDSTDLRGAWGYQAPRGSRVRVMDDNHVAKGVTVKGDAVAVLGDLSVEGEVGRDAVSVLGDNHIDGVVHRNVVGILGDITLGPNARVDGNVINISGEVHRDPAAVVHGQIKEQDVDEEFAPARAWWNKTLRVGRPLAIGAHLGWLWVLTAISLGFYALLGLVFPTTLRKCGDKLVLQPGLTVLAAVLSVLALPLLFVLLCITLIGIPIALLLLPVGVIFGVFFGKASIYGLVGRKFFHDRFHPAVTVLLGALIFVVLFLVPVLGLLLSLLVAFLGFGCVILTLFNPAPKPAVAIPAGSMATPTPAIGLPETPMAAAMPFSAPVLAAAPSPEPVAPTAPVPPVLPAAVTPPRFSATLLPRAGFWIRFAAALLDVILIGMCIGLFEAFFHAFGFHPGEAFPLWVVLYSVVMWAKRGTTIGGAVCGLRLVRLDDRPVDWGVAIVRAIGGFLSFAVAGIGFIWVAFDDERQSWHDKIAGTTIVRVPRGTALL